VKIAFQPPALLVAGLDDPGAGGGKLLARVDVGDRGGDELGKVGDPPLGACGEGERPIADRHDGAPEAAGDIHRSSDDRPDPDPVVGHRERNPVVKVARAAAR
jgi:hypothetical protein